ncbi:MAG: penicillin-binding protein activator [Pseudomonadota bacterium]
MTSKRPSRAQRLAPSSISSTSIAAVLASSVLLTACAGGPARPTVPIQTGEPRVDPDPQAGERTIPIGEDPVIVMTEPDDQQARALTPKHMEGRTIIRAAVLLPFTHPNRRVQSEAQGLLAAMELALFEQGDDSFLLIPKDTAGTQTGATEAAMEAVAEGADLFLGPLFSANVQAVKPIAETADAPIISFSNDPEAGGEGAYLASLSVEEEVARVVSYARQSGVETFAFLGPRSDYGYRVEQALRAEAARTGAGLSVSQFYDPASEAPTAEAQIVAEVLKQEIEFRPDRIALMIPEDGTRLRAVAPLIPYFGVDFRRIRMLGTSRWATDPSALREPTLSGALFAAPPPENLEAFEASYQRIYGRNAPDLASHGYDAASIAMVLDKSRRGIDAVSLTDEDGFTGVNGLFRFREDGRTERSLAVYEIDLREGAVLVERGPAAFETVFDPIG